MNKKGLSIIIALALVSSTLVFPATTALADGISPVTTAPVSTYGVTYEGHVQNKGWMKPVTTIGEQTNITAASEAGTDGLGLRVEALKLTGIDLPTGASITSQAHVQNKGWMDPVTTVGNAPIDLVKETGTDGLGLRVEAFKITLQGMPGYAVEYQAHVQNKGWMPAVQTPNGTDIKLASESGTDGQSLRMEAIRIEIVKTAPEKIAEVNAMNAVTNAETTKLASDELLAETAIKSVQVNSVSTTLTARIVIVEKEILDANIQTATTAVVKAESSNLTTDVNLALTLVNALPNDVSGVTVKTDLLSRLTVLQNAIAAAQAYANLKANANTEVSAYEVLANGNLKTYPLIDAAQAARTKIDLTGLNTTDTNAFLVRERKADVTVRTAEDAIKAITTTITTPAELTAAINNQKDNQIWIINAGTYDVPENMTYTTNGETGWYLPLTANNLTIIGKGNPVLTSTMYSKNGDWSTQNLITIFGNDVSISGVTLKTKEEANKVIEVVGNNFVLDNTIINPNISKFAGSIYFSNPGNTATISNTILNYGRIGGLTGATNAKVSLINDQINFAGATYDDPTDVRVGNAEEQLWGYYKTNATTAATVTATNLKITMSNAMCSNASGSVTDLQDAINMLPSGTTVTLEAGIYSCVMPTTPSGVTLVTNGATFVK